MTTEFYTTQEHIEEELRMLDTYCFNADQDLTDIQIMNIAEEAFDADVRTYDQLHAFLRQY